LTEPTSFVLPVDKPAGPTSHDVVAAARRALGIKRIGHTGTLDPFASGLMLLCVGNATRIAEYLTDLPKTYHASARLDGRTLTDDNTSDVLDASTRWESLTREQIDAALQQQVGSIMQMPPQYSAKKIAGERAYDIARRGDVATLAAVPVHISRITLIDAQLPEIQFEVECASGTYIRAIARDVGEQLGTGGYLTQLRRMRVGDYDADEALAMAELNERERVQAKAVRPADALAHLPAIELTAEQARAIRFGQHIVVDPPVSGIISLLQDGVLIAIGIADGKSVRPRKVMADA
jgi:tRNA pseudouridine55 synthase